jgi:hypothetical protein
MSSFDLNDVRFDGIKRRHEEGQNFDAASASSEFMAAAWRQKREIAGAQYAGASGDPASGAAAEHKEKLGRALMAD